ncbi:acetylcholine receptor subunit alpha-like 1 isoform X2 [Daphnia carinata]|uniref:acetylcholine receptor subunit alpha-like 1 isoform X2 n=1 Tax=Daphnia carinata TaxID=120202 RepID=UPI00286914CB|nr:acetylcholine receptor subunit alpha-like 1 isoform X2 [Daphnia carinata]
MSAMYSTCVQGRRRRRHRAGRDGSIGQEPAQPSKNFPAVGLSLADQQNRRPSRFSWSCSGLAQLVLPPLLILLSIGCPAAADQDAKRLYEDLLTDYNRLIRPVGNNSDRLTVKLGLKLSQLIDVNLKNQIMTTNMWVEQEWFDYKLKWDPEEYGGVKTLHVPSENIWLPDIVLYNNADGNYEVTIMTKAILRHDGTVTWKPPAIYKSFCEIDVEYFPFDEQTCYMKFGSWTSDGNTVDLQHLHQTPDSNVIQVGIDLREYYLSVEWDIMEVPAQRNEKYYSCCGDTPFPDIFFNITLRRKTLFYTVNLIIPCVGISCLSVLVFYLPADSGEKMSLCVSILLSLTVFFLLLAEIIPPTSLTVPLLGKYLLFTMILVTLSVLVTIIVLNVNFRSPSTHRMAPWVKRVFIGFLPKLLCITRPPRTQQLSEWELNALPTRGTEISIIPVGQQQQQLRSGCGDSSWPLNCSSTTAVPAPTSGGGTSSSIDMEMPYRQTPVKQGQQSCGGTASASRNGRSSQLSGPPPPLAAAVAAAENGAACQQHGCNNSGVIQRTSIHQQPALPVEMEHSIEDVRFIAQHMRNKDRFDSVIEDWKFVAMVLDRFFLWLFFVACVAGMAIIILQAPSLYDTTQPIDIKYSKIAQKKLKLKNMDHDFAFT